MAIFTSLLSPVLVSKHTGYFREHIKDKNDMKNQTVLISIVQNVSITNSIGKRILNDQVVGSCY